MQRTLFDMSKPTKKPKKQVKLGEEFPTYASLVVKVYQDIIGFTPDRSHFALSTKLLKKFAEEDKDAPGVRLYTLDQIAALIYDLHQRGVEIDGFRILNFPDLLRSFVDKDTEKYESILTFLLGNSNSSNTNPWEHVEW